MSRVWDHGPLDKAEILVLLAIADYCNDEGECWPAVSSIARKARMTERGVQKICARLCEIGWLEINLRKGRHGCNLYRVTPPNAVHPEHGSPRTPEHQTPNPVRQNPEPRSPEPSLTIKEPSDNNTAREIRDILCQWASPDAVLSFIAYRRKQKGKALTLTAAKRQANQLKTIFQAGGDTDDALGMAEERGWQSVQSDWYLKAKGNQHDKRNNHRVGNSDTDATARQIAFAARAGRTPSSDCF